jgi:hypothetical protein
VAIKDFSDKTGVTDAVVAAGGKLADAGAAVENFTSGTVGAAKNKYAALSNWIEGKPAEPGEPKAPLSFVAMKTETGQIPKNAESSKPASHQPEATHADGHPADKNPKDQAPEQVAANIPSHQQMGRASVSLRA